MYSVHVLLHTCVHVHVDTYNKIPIISVINGSLSVECGISCLQELVTLKILDIALYATLLLSLTLTPWFTRNYLNKTNSSWCDHKRESKILTQPIHVHVPSWLYG